MNETSSLQLYHSQAHLIWLDSTSVPLNPRCLLKKNQNLGMSLYCRKTFYFLNNQPAARRHTYYMRDKFLEIFVSRYFQESSSPEHLIIFVSAILNFSKLAEIFATQSSLPMSMTPVVDPKIRYLVTLSL
jgi:hypothetical protein